MSGTEERLTVELEQLDGFEFRVRFVGTEADDLITDEAEPLGAGRGPNPARLLTAAVGNCLAASLLFCLRKARLDDARVRATATAELDRNEVGRLRVGGIDVALQVEGVEEAQRARLERCLGLFEDYCIVTESVRHGIPVKARVERAETMTLAK